MNATRLKGVALAFAAAAFAARADAASTTVDAAGAATLAHDLSASFGAAAFAPGGSATVTPDGDHYTVRVDFPKALAALPKRDAPFTLDMPAAIMDLRPLADGAWAFDLPMPGPISFKAATISESVDYEGGKFTGEFDPATGAMRHFDFVGPGAKVSAVDANAGLEQHAVVGAMKQSGTGTVNAAGGVDMKMDADIDSYSVDAKPAPGGKMPALAAFHAATGKAKAGVTAADLRMRPLLDLWAFAVAHFAQKDLTSTEMDDLRGKLRALGPVFGEFAEAVDLQNLQISTVAGGVGFGDIVMGFDVGGAVENSAFRFSVGAKDIQAPVLLMPGWMVDLAPTEFSMGAKVSGYDARAGWHYVVDHVDFTRPEPLTKAQQAEAAKAFLPNGTIKIDLPPGHVKSPKLDLSFDGALISSAGGAGPPTGDLHLHARDFDGTIAALKAAGPAVPPQALAGIALMKGLAKTETDGSLSWDVRLGDGGSVTVNGTKLK
ncbi:MAG: DUF2125 domain-containing protein [Hyphomicrobiales bacterium]|nr:DUF2125 domain-containing protein [Hyphomicrobiales bacterium]